LSKEQKQMIEPPHYQVYILRLWQERPASFDRPATWRFSLENVLTRRQQGFANLEKLVAFLQEQVGVRETKIEDNA